MHRSSEVLDPAGVISLRRTTLPLVVLVFISAFVVLFADPTYAAGKCAGQQPTQTGTEGPDTITGTPGDDVILGLGGNDTINGLGGNDALCGKMGLDSITGGPGRDRVIGDQFEPEFCGRHSSVECGRSPGDHLVGGRGHDRLVGGMDGDTFVPKSGNDVLIGGVGPGDLVSYRTSPKAVWVDLDSGPGGDDGLALAQGTDELESVEDIVGSRFDDKLRGDDTDSFMSADGSQIWMNVIHGLAGDDVIDTGRGLKDEVNGGPGDDTIHGGHNWRTDSSFNIGGDLIIGEEGDDRIFGGGSTFGDDQLLGGEGNDQIMAEVADTEISRIPPEEWEAGEAHIDGGPGDDELIGTFFEDFFDAGPGLDSVEARGGDDSLDVQDGESPDVASGGKGVDECLSDPGDTVTGCP